jgi:putative mRNA 3-end processing factor
MLGIERSLRESVLIVAHPLTFEMMEVLGHRVPPEKAVPLGYGASIEVDGERLTLLRARHIAGSSQVLVESPWGSYGYTGDFKMPGTPPMRGLDVLVLDATYGNPRLQRRWGEWDAIAALIEIVERFIGEGPVWIYGYHGKLQEVMAQLRIRGVDYPFKADPVTLRLAEIASRFYRVDLSPVEPYTGGDVDEAAVVFVHTVKLPNYRRRRGMHVRLTGWEMRAPAAIAGDRLINVSFSDHATLREIVEYVDDARPRLVLVDAYRGRDAAVTAKYLERTLGVKAAPSPPASATPAHLR